MHDPIKAITKMGIPIISHVFATRAVKEEYPFMSWTTSEFMNAIRTIVGNDDVVSGIILRQDAKYTLLYLIQTLVSYNNKNLAIDPVDAFNHARKCSLTFQSDNAIAISLEDGYESANDTSDSVRSGSKVELSRAIFREYMVEGESMTDDVKKAIRSRFVEELDMTKPASRTYFRNAEMYFLGK